MATQQTQNAGPTEILCRLDRATNKPVVFISHTYANNQIQMWDGGDELKIVPLHEYQRTEMLSKADEDHVAKRFNRHFKEQAVVRHRLPRQQRERPQLFAPHTNDNSQKEPAPQANTTPPAANNQPASNVISLSTANALSTNPAVSLLPAAGVPAAPVSQGEIPPTDLSSVDLLGKITEEGAKLKTLAESVATLTAQLQQATTDHEASKRNYAILTAQYQMASDREAEEERRRKQAALDAALAPLIVLKHEADTNANAPAQPEAQQPAGQQQQAEPPKEQAQDSKGPARGAGGKFQKSSKAKSIESQPLPPQDPNGILAQFTPEQLEAMAAAQRARQGAKATT